MIFEEFEMRYCFCFVALMLITILPASGQSSAVGSENDQRNGNESDYTSNSWHWFYFQGQYESHTEGKYAYLSAIRDSDEVFLLRCSEGAISSDIAYTTRLSKDAKTGYPMSVTLIRSDNVKLSVNGIFIRDPATDPAWPFGSIRVRESSESDFVQFFMAGKYFTIEAPWQSKYTLIGAAPVIQKLAHNCK
jgi:hypothetical protein